MSEFTRRRLLSGIAAVTASSPLGLVLGAGAVPDLVDVSGKDPGAMVRAALAALGGIGRFVRKGASVVIKPNAGFANPPAWATTTNPDVVAAIAQACLKAKAKQVTIIECTLPRPHKAFVGSGIKAAVANLPGVRLKILGSPSVSLKAATGEITLKLPPATDEFQRVKVEGGIDLKSVEVAKAVLSADVFINVPVAKVHRGTGVSFGMKNAMGVIWDRQALHRMDLHQAIADLARVVRPHLTILDATRVLLTNGPCGPGETAALGRLVAGRNVVSVDAYGLTLARFDHRRMTPTEVKYLEHAARAGLGVIDLRKLKVKKVAV